MTKLTRFSVSIEDRLFACMEKIVAQRHYDNRSEFIRDLIRETLAYLSARTALCRNR